MAFDSQPNNEWLQICPTSQLRLGRFGIRPRLASMNGHPPGFLRPEAERFCRECFWISHEILVADEKDLLDFMRMIENICNSAPAAL